MGLWSKTVEFFRNNRFVKALISTNKKYVELISIFKSRVIVFYVISSLSILARSVYFYNIYPEDWQSMTTYAVIYTYSSVSIGLLVYYYLVTLGYRDKVIKAFLSRFIDTQRIKTNRERRKAYKPLFEQKLRDAGLKGASFISVLLISAWVGPLSVTIFKGPLLYPFIFWYIWFCWLQFYRAKRIFKFAIDNPAPLEYRYIRPKPLQDWIDKPFVYVHGNKGAIAEGFAKVGRLASESSKKVVSHVSSDPGRALLLFSTGTSLFFGGICGTDYMISEISGRTAIISRAVEYLLCNNYSADIETRHKAGWLRFRNIELVGCVISDTRVLDPELVANLYELNQKPGRISVLEDEKSKLIHQLTESYKIQLEQKDKIIELMQNSIAEKDTIIEQKNRIIELEKKLLESDKQ